MTHKKRATKVAVLLTHRAIDDLRAIERFSVNQWGQKVADKYLKSLNTALDRLRENPEILRLEPTFSTNLYFYRVNKHILVCDYHVPRVIVLAVVHTSMDLSARLCELEPQLLAESEILQAKLPAQPNEK